MTKEGKTITQNDADFLGSVIGWTVGIAVIAPLCITIVLMILDEIKERKKRRKAR